VATVLHYVPRWLPLSQGFVHALLRRSRHRAVVVSRRSLENVEAFPLRPVHSLAALRETGSRWGHRPLSAAIAGLVIAHRVTLIHVHFGDIATDVVGVGRVLRRPIVLSLHGSDVTALAQRAPGHYDSLVPIVARVIVPSRFLADRARAVGFPAEAIEIIPAGVDIEFFSPTPLPDGDLEALFVGRLVEKKGLDVLLDAWSTVERNLPEAQLRVIGDGPLRDLLRSGKVKPIHELPEPGRRSVQVRDAIRRATVVVQPSRTATDGDAESMLLVNLEAQASARPVVTTHHGGIPEFVDEGATAVLVPEGDPAALADALVELLSDRKKAEHLAAAGPRWVQRFDARRCTARVDDVYDVVLRENRARGARRRA